MGKLRAVRACWADDRGSTWPTATPAPTASSTSRCWRAWAGPTPSTPTPSLPVCHRPAVAHRALGPSAAACPPSSDSSRTTCCARSSREPSPTPASTSPGWSTSRIGARCCWPPTTAATSTWPRWPSWPRASGARCASWASASCSTPRSSARWPEPSVASPSTAGAVRPPLREAEAALRAGEVVIVLPQGTIPRGEAFFDPVLHGKTGTARLAAATGAPVVPVGLWGTERVWPRSARLPDVTLVRTRRRSVRVGPAGAAGAPRRHGRHRGDHGGHRRPAPAEARVRHEPSAEELARTYPEAPSGRTRLAEVTHAPRGHDGQRRLAVGPAAGHGGRGPGRPGLDPALRHLTAGRPVALVSGHQRQDHHHPPAGGGARARPGAVVTNATGVEHAAGPRGRPARLAGRPGRARGRRGVPAAGAPAPAAAAVVLLNLSRDQLDRTNEVRMLAGRWRAALAAADETTWWPTPTTRWWCGGRARRPSGLGRGRSALAARRRGLPRLRGAHRLRRTGAGPARAASPAPSPTWRSVDGPTGRTDAVWADGNDGPGPTWASPAASTGPTP